MSIVDQLESLVEQRISGSITESAFTETKGNLLTVAESQAHPRRVAEFAELNRQKELAELDLAWEVERQTHYMRFLRNGHGVLPSSASARSQLLGCGILISLVGILALAFSYLFLLLLMPVVALSGVLLIGGIREHMRLEKYRKALTVYESRRQTLLDPK